MCDVVAPGDHRIIEYFGFEGTFRGHLAQPLCSEQGHLSLDDVAQSSIQLDLELFQGWGLHCLSGQSDWGDHVEMMVGHVAPQSSWAP